MNAPLIVNVKNFDVNKLSFSVGPKKPNRMPAINMKYDGQPFYIRFPSKMGVRMFSRTDDKTGQTNYSLLTNMKGCDPYARERATGDTEYDALYNLIVFDLKDKIIKTATEKTKEWFKSARSAEAIKESFKTMFRVSGDKIEDEYVPNGKYPPSMTIKLPVYENKVSTDFVDENNEPVKDVFPHTLLKVFPPKASVELNMVVAPSIYVMAGSNPGTGGAFGVTWKLNYAKVFKPSKLSASAVFADDEETEQTEETTNVEQAEEETARPTTPVQQEQVSNAPPAPSRKKRSAANV